jgi:type IV pilus assembly protein PilC
MNVYRYKAYDYRGKIHSGNLLVASEEEAISILLRNNLTPVQIRLLPQSLIIKFFQRLFFKISFRQKIFLFRSLYLILKSGITLNKGLEVLTREAKGGLRDFLFFLNYNLQKGEPFYRTFANFPQIFSTVEIETIKAGEISGNLVSNLEKLTENLEREREIRNEIISNLIYPAIVLFLSFAVLVLLITFVMPKISILLAQFTSNPPLLTRVLISVSNFVNNNLSFVIYLLTSSFISLIVLFSIKKFRSFLLRIFFSLPFISQVYFDLSLSQAFFILRHLLSSGINLTQALIISATANPHSDIKNAFLEIEKGLRAGGRFLDLLIAQPKIPLFASNILGVAAEAGFLEETLQVMENFYLEEFRRKVRNLLNLLQPALLLFVGFMVGFVAVAVLVPIYQQISQQLQPGGREQMPGGL